MLYYYLYYYLLYLFYIYNITFAEVKLNYISHKNNSRAKWSRA